MATSRTFSFTRPMLDALPIPPSGERLVVRDAKVQGLELRVTATGVKTFSLRRRIKGGRVERVTIGTYPSVSIDVARDNAKVIDAQHAIGVSAASAIRKQRRADRTFEESLTAFVDDDSTRDAPLKARTRRDYLHMIRPAGDGPKGRKHSAGELHAIADRKVEALTGPSLKALHKRLSERSVARASYAMRVVRAVLKYEGVRMEDDPFDLTTARRDRITIPASKVRDRVIPFERLGDWWKAADNVQTGDAFQLLLLTGMRRGELAGVQRRHFDQRGGRLQLRDTENGKPHTVLLSRQALALVQARAANKDPDDVLFSGAANPQRSLGGMIAATGIQFSAHDCRRTFATIAASRLPGYVVKRLLNHSAGNDVTAAHYVHLDEATLREAWQVVADAIAGAVGAPQPSASDEVPTASRKVVSLAERRSANAA